MASTFDGVNLIITLPEAVGGVLNLDVEEIYDDAKQWHLNANNRKYPFPFRTSGGEELTPGINAGSYYQLQNQRDWGWRIRPFEADANYYFSGNLTPADASEDILIPTIGAFTVGVFGLQPITQNVSQLLTAQESAGFNGIVAIDTVNGTSGTAVPIGYATTPVDNLADAITIATREGITAFSLKGEITLTQAFTRWTFIGLSAESADIINLNSQSVANSVFQGVELRGAGTGQMEALQCGINNVSGIGGIFRGCGLINNITLGDDTTMDAGFSEVAGNTEPWVSLNGLALNFGARGWKGGLEVRDVSNASASVSLDWQVGRGLLAASNTDGEIVYGGNVLMDDQSAGSTIVPSDIREQVFKHIIETGYTFEQVQRVLAAHAAGNVNQDGAGVYQFRDLNNTKDRIEGDDAANGGRLITAVDAT